MENEAQTIENFASELAQAEQQEQPTEDSSPDAQEAGEEGSSDEGQQQSDASEQGAEEGGEGQDDQPTEESSADRIVKWETASGEKYEVPESELRSGYMRQQDYTQKTQAAAAQVQERFQTLQSMAGDIGALVAAQQQLAQFQGIDWNALEQQDPARAQSLWRQQQQLQQQVGAAQGQLQQKHNQIEAAQKAATQQAQAEAAEYVRTRVKGLDAKGLQELSAACIKAGHKPEDLARVASGPLVHDLWKARQWDALQAKKPEVQNRVKSLPPASAGRPARATAPASPTEAVDRALKSNKPMSMKEYARLLAST